jgi:hypothetical protein
LESQILILFGQASVPGKRFFLDKAVKWDNFSPKPDFTQDCEQMDSVSGPNLHSR